MEGDWGRGAQEAKTEPQEQTKTWHNWNPTLSITILNINGLSQGVASFLSKGPEKIF